MTTPKTTPNGAGPAQPVDKAAQLMRAADAMEARAREVDGCDIYDASAAANFRRQANAMRDEARSYRKAALAGMRAKLEAPGKRVRDCAPDGGAK